MLTAHDLTEAHKAEPLLEMRRQMLDGEWPRQCQRCQTEHDLKGYSRASHEAAISPFTQADAIQVTAADGSIAKDLTQSLTVHFGNVCNLKCSMCGPSESNQWYDDFVALTGQQQFRFGDQTVHLSSRREGEYHAIDLPSWADPSRLDALCELAATCRDIHFAGGEPLMNRHHWQFLRRLVRAGISHKLNLSYNTNGTRLTPGFFALWRNFAKVKLGISIDAYGAANEAIRYPSRWHDIEANLRLLDATDARFDVYICATISVLAIEHVVTLFHWLDEQALRKIRYTLNTTHAVHRPSFMNMAILSADQQDILFTHLRRMADQLKCDKETYAVIDFYATLSATQQLSDVTSARRQLIKFRDLCERTRQQDWRTVFPFITSCMDAWE